MTSQYLPGTNIGPYVVSRTLSDKGGMGKLLVVTAQTGGEEWALKVIKKEAKDTEEERTKAQERFEREARLLEDLRKLESPHLLTFVGNFYADDLHYLVTELLKGDTVEKLLNGIKQITYGLDKCAPSGLPVWLFKDCTLQLVSTLALLHSNKIAHRDLKPNNIMATQTLNKILDSGQIQLKLIDFGIGLSEACARLTEQHVPGARLYSAPEVFTRSANTPETFEEACARDRFALGLVLYELWMGKRFWPLDQYPIMYWLQNFEALYLQASRELQSCPHTAVVMGLLHQDPKKRLLLTDALLLMEGKPAATGNLTGPGSYQGETYSSGIRPVGSSPGAAFYPSPAAPAQPAEKPTPPPITPGVGQTRPLIKGLGLAALCLLATGGALLGLRESTGEAMVSPEDVRQDSPPALMSDTIDQRLALLPSVSAPASIASPASAPAPIVPAAFDSPPVHGAETQHAAQPPPLERPVSTAPVRERPVQAALQAPVRQQRTPDQTLSLTSSTSEATSGVSTGATATEAVMEASTAASTGPTSQKPAASASGSSTVPQGSHSNLYESAPAAQIAALPSRTLVLDKKLIFQDDDGGDIGDRKSHLEIRALIQDAPARAMADGTVRAVKGCGASQTCTVEMLHFNHVVSRYEGCASTNLMLDSTVKKSDVVCYLEQNDFLKVEVLANPPGKDDTLEPIDTERWEHFVLRLETTAARPWN